MSDPLVACVIVAFHRVESLSKLLDLLEHPRVQVVVVNVEDNAEVAALAGSRNMSVANNVGYASAVNLGVVRTTAPVIVYMNDDLELSAEGAIKMAAIISSGVADVLVPAIVDEQECRQLTILALPTFMNLVKEWMLLPDFPCLGLDRVLQTEKWRSPNDVEPITAATGAVVAVKASMLRAVPIPESYFLYWEELDWFWQLSKLQAKVIYDPSITVTHKGGRDELRPDKSRLMARNVLRCVRQTQGRNSAALAWPIVILWNARLVVVTLAQVGLRYRAKSVLRARMAGLVAALGGWREVIR